MAQQPAAVVMAHFGHETEHVFLAFSRGWVCPVVLIEYEPSQGCAPSWCNPSGCLSCKNEISPSLGRLECHWVILTPCIKSWLAWIITWTHFYSCGASNWRSCVRFLCWGGPAGNLETKKCGVCFDKGKAAIGRACCTVSELITYLLLGLGMDNWTARKKLNANTQLMLSSPTFPHTVLCSLMKGNAGTSSDSELCQCCGFAS